MWCLCASTCVGADVYQSVGEAAEGLWNYLQRCQGGFYSLPFTKVVESEAEGKPTGVCVFQFLLDLLHDCLDDGGGDVSVTRAHSDHTACKCRYPSNLKSKQQNELQSAFNILQGPCRNGKQTDGRMHVSSALVR